MHVSRRSRVFLFLFVIFTLLLASCGGANNQQGATDEVPQTGQTDAVPGTGTDITPEGTTGVETDATPTTEGGAADATPTTAEGGDATPTTAAGGDATPTTEGGAGGGTGATGEGPTWTGEQIGGTVTVLAIWGGAELDNFNAMIQPFIDATGIEVQVETTRDIGATLNTRISGGNPPDVAGLPNPGQMVAMANAGSLQPLDEVLDLEAMRAVYDQGFIDLAMVDGQLYGIFTKVAVKSLVWYNPKAFDAAGYTVPTSWEELQALEEQIVADGKTPWCVGIDGGAGSGWPGTDWVEDILLHQSGPEAYDAWVNHEVPWTDDTVRQAFETWGEIVTDETMVYGGPQTVVATNFGEAFRPMFEEDPGCFMHRQANFITTFFTEQFPELVAGEDYNFFVFPSIDESLGQPLEVAGDLFGMFNDTPQARALIQYLVTAEAQSIWAERGGFLSANKAVDPGVYPDEITGQIGELITSADAVRFDASDLMPEGVNSAFSQAVLNYVQDPGSLDSILETVETTAEGEYQTTP